MTKIQNQTTDGLWPDKRHIGHWVATAGPVSLDERSLRTRRMSDLSGDSLPTGYKLILRGIEGEMAWLYHDRLGVLYLPVQLFIQWSPK